MSRAPRVTKTGLTGGVALLMFAAPPATAAPSAASGAPAPAPAAAPEAFPGQYAARGAPNFPPAPKRCLELAQVADRCVCLEWLAHDWGNLRRYAAANARLAAPRKGERRVVFVGDSITDNWSLPPAGGFFPGKPYVNRGIGSQGTAQMLVRFRRDVVALAPAVVVILAGTNDVSGNAGPTPPKVTARNLATMTELAQLAGIRVVLATLLPVRDGVPGADGKPIDRTTERPLARIDELNRWIAAFTRDNGLGLVDYHAAMKDDSGQLRDGLSGDGVHPNAAGYAVMAPLAEKAITQALRARPPARPAPVKVPAIRADAAGAASAAGAADNRPAAGAATSFRPAPSSDDEAPRIRLSPRGCGRLPTAEQRCACLAEVLRNWAGLDRHAAANELDAPALTAASAAPGATRTPTVFFGETLIASWAALPASFFATKPYFARGIDGQSTEQMLVRFRQDVLELRPHVVVLAPGPGDLVGETGRRSPAEVQDNVDAMAALARLHGIRVVLASLTPTSDGRRRPDGRRALPSSELPPAQLLAVNGWMAQHARDHGDVYLDWHASLADPSGQLRPELSDDGLLPNAAGFALMAPLTEEAISRARAKRGNPAVPVRQR